tara:strand:+ start:752 stop:1141 length:390 start_codon:yes stop_codon:yes gene_type:complete
MSKIYEFTLHPSGYDPKSPRFYRIGAGTLNDGIAIIKDMEKQFVAWCDGQEIAGSPPSMSLEQNMKQMFKLRIPADPTPIWLWEGADLYATGGPFGEYWKQHITNDFECDAPSLEKYYFTYPYKWEKDT